MIRKRPFILISLLFSNLMFSCSNNTNENIHNKIHQNNNSLTSIDNSSYVVTGLYFLSDEGEGIKMQKDHSSQVYNISKKPFVSIKNILRVTAKKNIVENIETYNINIVLDNEGTKYFEQGTGNPSNPYIAIVIANRLLYVVKSSTQINTGLMQLILVGYTEIEINEMIIAVTNKR